MKILITESQALRLFEKYKVGNEERIKLFENDDFLLVVPLTHTASCKYGAKTKWCTSAKDDDMFQRHDALGALGYLIIKNPDIAEKLGYEKFAFFLNAPSAYYGRNYNPERIVVYDELNQVIPNIMFLRMMDEIGKYVDFKTMAEKFVSFTQEKFSPGNPERIRQGVRKPF
jgi:hypothetical protein